MLGVGTGAPPDDDGADHRSLPLQAYSMLALSDDPAALEGRRIRLIGFVTPRQGSGWCVSRITIRCCAADATAFTVVVDAPPEGLAADQRVEVIGTYGPPQRHPTGGYPEAVIRPETVTPIEAPADTYVG